MPAILGYMTDGDRLDGTLNGNTDHDQAYIEAHWFEYEGAAPEAEPRELARPFRGTFGDGERERYR